MGPSLPSWAHLEHRTKRLELLRPRTFCSIFIYSTNLYGLFVLTTVSILKTHPYLLLLFALPDQTLHHCTVYGHTTLLLQVKRGPL